MCGRLKPAAHELPRQLYRSVASGGARRERPGTTCAHQLFCAHLAARGRDVRQIISVGLIFFGWCIQRYDRDITQARLFRNKVNRAAVRLRKEFYQAKVTILSESSTREWWRHMKSLMGYTSNNDVVMQGLANSLCEGNIEALANRLNEFLVLYNTLFLREEIFAKNEFEIFSREDIFANILFTRKYLPSKISSRENFFPRRYLPAKLYSRELFPGRKYVG